MKVCQKLPKLQDNLKKKGPQEENFILIADGVYRGAENSDLAAFKDIQPVTTNLIGNDVSCSSHEMTWVLCLKSVIRQIIWIISLDILSLTSNLLYSATVVFTSFCQVNYKRMITLTNYY